MRTLRRLSNRKLDQLQDRLAARLDRATWPPSRGKILNKMVKVSNERLRRIGL